MAGLYETIGRGIRAKVRATIWRMKISFVNINGNYSAWRVCNDVNNKDLRLLFNKLKQYIWVRSV